MKNVYKSIKNGFILIALILSTSCSDSFFDVNENPNDPPVSTPGLTLPVAQNTFASLNGTTMTYLGNMVMYNWATPSNWSANGQLFRYQFTNSFNNSVFTTPYGSIFKDLTYIQGYEDPTGAVDYTAYKVIAQVIKGFQYQYLVDLYGDVPFTEANKRAENTTPKYDDSETIYKSVIDSLTIYSEKALNLPEIAENPESSDIIFGGNMEQWIRFANTIKLRMLIRLSNTGQDAYIKQQIDLINANGMGYITEDVVANPNYSKDTNKQSPFWNYAGYNTSDAEQDRHDYTVASDYTIDYLTTTNDPRIGYLYSESEDGGEFKGVWQSTALPGEGFTSGDLSKIGVGLLKSFDQDQPIMLLSEALFLQAEAVVRGYLPGGAGEAQDLYEKAITASFDYLGVAESPSNYYNQNIPNVSWSASTDKIQAIIVQKWIALNGTSSIESWMEWVRTGFPNNLPTPEDSDGVRPVRLLYPTSEYSTNGDNVPPSSINDAFTKYPFWKQ